MQHDNNAEQQDGEPVGGYANWRHRKKAVAARNEGITRRKELVDAYLQALGGRARVTAIVMEDIERTADLVVLAREMRAAVRQGTAKLADMTRLEGAADRAVRRLALPAPGAAPSGPTLQEYLASHEGDV